MSKLPKLTIVRAILAAMLTLSILGIFGVFEENKSNSRVTQEAKVAELRQRAASVAPALTTELTRSFNENPQLGVPAGILKTFSTSTGFKMGTLEYLAIHHPKCRILHVTGSDHGRPRFYFTASDDCPKVAYMKKLN